ncbi:MAG TPA: hypothetical protein ENJ82_06720, partial [Bacteroidetes bacterium]|nr:hypothetical protein [Bacteroidota bacterium]
MNRPGCFLLAFLLLFWVTACKELASTPGGGGGISSVPQERLATPINFVAESGAGLAADSGNVGNFAPEPYL